MAATPYGTSQLLRTNLVITETVRLIGIRKYGSNGCARDVEGCRFAWRETNVAGAKSRFHLSSIAAMSISSSSR